MIRVRLPFPPSVNSYWRTRVMGAGERARAITYVSAEGKEFRKNCVGWLAAAGVREPIAGAVVVRLLFYFPSHQGDLDNRIKSVLDALQGTAFENDKQVWRVEAERRLDRRQPRVEVEIEKFQISAA